MTSLWLEAAGLVADAVTILGVPVLAAATWHLVTEIRKERAERRTMKMVSQDSLEFYDDDGGAAVNLVPLESMKPFPRPGDLVLLPGETHGSKNFGQGMYEVNRIVFSFSEAAGLDQPCPAVPWKVIAHVRRKERER